MSASRRAAAPSYSQFGFGGPCRDLALIERQIAGRARRMTITTGLDARSRRFRCSRWRPADERRFRELVERLAFERRREIEALALDVECVQAGPRLAMLHPPKECDHG